MTPADLAKVAHEERQRRVKASRPLIQRGLVTLDKAAADELLWFEIEMLARRYAGEAEGRRYGYPRDFAALVRSADATLAKAREANAPDAKILGLWHLRRWLHRFAQPAPEQLEAAA